MSSSDEESDIEAMFEAAASAVKFRNNKPHAAAADSDSDDDDDSSCGSIQLLRHSSRNRRDKTHAKLQRLQQNKARQDRLNRKRLDSDDSDNSDDDDDDDDNNITATSPALAKGATKRRSPTIDLDFSDDDESPKRKRTTTIQELQRRGVVEAQIAAELQKFHAATEKFSSSVTNKTASTKVAPKVTTKTPIAYKTRSRACNENNNNHHNIVNTTDLVNLAEEDAEDDNYSDIEDDDGIAIAKPISVVVEVTIKTILGDAENQARSVTIQSMDTDKITNFKQNLLKGLQLNPETHFVVSLQHDGKSLRDRQVLREVQVTTPTKTASSCSKLTLKATINSSEINGHNNNKKKEDYGKIIVVTLRQGETKTQEIKIGMKQPLKYLIEKYNGSCKRLEFDGDTLNLQQTPTFYEMESEDIIEVIV